MSSTSTSVDNLSLTLEQAQRIITRNLSGHDQSTIVKLTELRNSGYSFTPGARTYLVDLSTSLVSTAVVYSSFLTIAHPSSQGTNRGYRPNSLFVINQLLTLIRTQTEIPIPESTLDTSLSLVPWHYLLSPPTPIPSSAMVPLSRVRKLGLLKPMDALLIDLQLGKFLGQLHSRVQNDWFGQPRPSEPLDPTYSWQESFTALLEALLVQVESGAGAHGVQLPFEEIRRYLSRAIAFFLFDDVEVPSFVWFTGSEDDIYLYIPPSTGTPLGVPKSPMIAAILPNVAHALWGDPLLESFFLPNPGPTQALLEGYVGGGGGPLTVFPRQKTKRIWYTLFLALVVLTERGAGAGDGGGTDADADADAESDVDKRVWAKSTVDECVRALEDAPCY